VFVGISTNNVSDQFLDIYMEAETSSWVAVGFTQTRSMVGHGREGLEGGRSG